MIERLGQHEMDTADVSRRHPAIAPGIVLLLDSRRREPLHSNLPECRNNVLFIFDNDTAGSAKFDAARSLQPLPNLGIMKLPDLPDLQTFETVGPTGVDVADINGRASSIECFLDHSWKNSGTPRVRWTGYFTQTDSYQGELTDKKAYVKDFLALGQKDLPHYDASKLQTLLDAIRNETRKIGAARVDAFWFEG